jgi:hypothetical protein
VLMECKFLFGPVTGRRNMSSFTNDRDAHAMISLALISPHTA